jgi:DNA-binding transcriptional LysR family regulator
MVEANPLLSVDLVFSDQISNLINESLDIVVRIGEPKMPGLIMRKLADNHRVLVAAPSYLERRGKPTRPQELAGHDCLLFGTGSTMWRLIGPKGEIVEVPVSTRLLSNSGDVAYDWALSGHGLILKSIIDVERDLRDGRLVRVLPKWQSEPAPICALFPTSRHMPTRVRLFLDAMAERLKRASAKG